MEITNRGVISTIIFLLREAAFSELKEVFGLKEREIALERLITLSALFFILESGEIQCDQKKRISIVDSNFV